MTRIPLGRWIRRLRLLDRRVAFAAAVALVLAIAGITAIGYAAIDQQRAPQPGSAGQDSHTTARRSPSATDPSGHGATHRATGPTMSASTPVTLRIPAIHVSSRLQQVGKNADNTIEVPAPGPHYDEAAWYEYSRTPGEAGTAIIEGHVDSARHGPSVFFRLGAVKHGDRVLVTRHDGTVAVFVIDRVRRYPKKDFPTEAVYADTTNATLRLVTCGGSFDRTSGHYRDNIVVFAHLRGTENGPRP